MKTLAEIYAAIPKVECRQLCSEQCSLILLGKVELDAMEKAFGGVLSHKPGCLSCPALDTFTKTCTVYDVRPFICRLFGASRKLMCPHGCKPERQMTDQEEHALLLAYNRIVGGLEPMPGMETIAEGTLGSLVGTNSKPRRTGY